MRVVFIILCFYNTVSFAQTKQQTPVNIYGGNNQFGNQNTQNIYTEPILTESLKRELVHFLTKIEYDSNFHYTKYYVVNCTQPSNGNTLSVQMDDFLQKRGLINWFTHTNQGGGIGVRYGDTTKGILINLVKRDSLFTIIVGQIDKR